MTLRYTKYGLEVRTRLLQKHMTIKELARKVGCSAPHMSEMLKGTREVDKWRDAIEGVLDDEGQGEDNT